MSEADLLIFLAAKFPILTLVFAALGSLVVVGQAVVVLTPSKADDEAWAKIQGLPVIGPIMGALTSFAVIQKKPAPQAPEAAAK